MSRRSLVALSFMLLALSCLTASAGWAQAQSAPAAETPRQRDTRMNWWREARFGLFIHWGLYAVPAGQWDGKPASGTGEWIMRNAKIPVSDYEKLAAQFNPVKFDARRWVQIAKDAGMQYIVITSKHHDGFCLFDTRQTDYDVMDATPFKRDILAELSQACREADIKFCLYHSILDWHHPDFLPRLPWDTRPTEDADFDRYTKYMKNELRELVTQYGPLGVLWFDGEWEGTWTHDRGEDLYRYVRELQPGIIINNRVDKGRAGMAGLTVGEFLGDFGTPEQEIPANGLPGVDWESCMTMNDTWGFRSDDHNWKSAETMIRMLIDIASKGGNFLLNVGPTAEGEIPEPSVERLAAIGAWVRENDESVRGTTASPFRRLPFDGRCTVRGHRLYLHVFNWPADHALKLEGVRNKAVSADLLSRLRSPSARRSQGLPIRQDGTSVRIELPPRAPDKVATVVVLDLDGPPNIDNTFFIRSGADGSFELAAKDADVHGQTARYEHGGGKDNIGYWTDAGDWVSWTLRCEKPGEYDVAMTVAAAADSADAEFTVEVGPQQLEGRVPATGSWTERKTLELGRVKLAAGDQVLTVKAKTKPGYAVMNLFGVKLTPR